jgi:serine/threonine-protein kinase
VAHAQAPAPDPADAAYQEARRLYDLREWDAAIAKFKEAYRIRPDAPSLFNIAQSNRLKGDCTEALNFYKTYKRNFPKEKNIDKVDKFIADMEECAKTAPVKTEPVKTEPVKTEPVKTEPVKTEPAKTEPRPDPGPPERSDPGKPKRVAGLVVGGLGVVSLGASVFFGLRARTASKDAEAAMMGETWNPSIETRGETAARNGKIAVGVGVALVGTGVVLYILGRKSSDESAAVGVVPSSDGATLVWGNRF